MARATFGTAPAHRASHFPVTYVPVCAPDRRKPLRQRLGVVVGSALVMGLGVTVVASAQSNSPFASKRKTQAWEQPAPTQPTPQAPQSQPRQNPPSQPQPQTLPPVQQPRPLMPSAPQTQPTAQPDWSQYQAPPSTGTAPSTGHHNVPSHAQSGQTYGTYGSSGSVAPQPQSGQTGYGQPTFPQSPRYQTPPTYGQPAQTSYPTPAPRRSWSDRLGLGNLSTLIKGGFRAGVAARDRDGWEEAFVADADIEAEVSAITQGGLEYGIHGQVRAQYDEDRRGFARRLPDCPPTLAGCASTLIGTVPTSYRGHTSQFYTDGPDVADDVQIALESAHIFLRSAYGDITVGRDDGAAFLFSLGAPTLLNVGASNSPVDYTGLDTVKTVNDASGFSEKITYTSPRLLGDTVGVGVQLGVSYALDAEICGVDYCVDLDDVPGVLAPDLEDVIEAGLALDRTFDNGLSVEGTLTYARGSEQSGVAVFDDLESFGAGLEVSLSDWTVGGSWLNSNQGLMNGDYEAYDVGLTWKPSKLGFTLGYGHATDDLVQLTSDQVTGGVSYDWNDRVRFGAGVQYADRETLRDVGGTAQPGSEDSLAVFIEGGITF